MMLGREIRTPFEARTEKMIYRDTNSWISKQIQDTRAAMDAIDLVRAKREYRNQRNRDAFSIPFEVKVNDKSTHGKAKVLSIKSEI